MRYAHANKYQLISYFIIMYACERLGHVKLIKKNTTCNLKLLISRPPHLKCTSLPKDKTSSTCMQINMAI